MLRRSATAFAVIAALSLGACAGKKDRPQADLAASKITTIGVNSYLNLRAEPSTQADVLRQLYYGQELIVGAAIFTLHWSTK